MKKRSNTEFSSRFDGFSTSSLEIPCSILDIRFSFPSSFSPFSTADGSKKWECLEAETCPVFYGLYPAQRLNVSNSRGTGKDAYATWMPTKRFVELGGCGLAAIAGRRGLRHVSSSAEPR